MTYSKKIIIRYTPEVVQQPVIYLLSQKHHLVFNILKARIFPRREGVIVLELSGEKDDFDRGIAFLKEMGLTVEPLSKSVSQNMERCISCGACTGFCPTGALFFEKETQKVVFDAEKCNGCELCVSGCPVHAMEINLM